MEIKNITVQYVSREKLIDFLNIKLQKDEKLVIENFAIWSDKYGIDIDCCFWELANHHINNEVKKCIEVECRIRRKTKDGYTMRMDRADFVKTISLNDYLNLAEDMQLVDFIRFNYNPRIIGNQRLLMKHIKEWEQQEA